MYYIIIVCTLTLYTGTGNSIAFYGNSIPWMKYFIIVLPMHWIFAEKKFTDL